MLELLTVVKITIYLIFITNAQPLNRAVAKHTSNLSCQTLKSESNFCVGFWEYKEISK